MKTDQSSKSATIKPEYISQAKIIEERKWTKSLRERFLKEPDLTKPNPFYKSGPPMKLYLLGRVIEIEESEEFKIALVPASRRRKTRLVVVDRQTKELSNYIDSLKIKVPHFSKEQLYKMSINHYNDRQEQRFFEGRIYEFNPVTRYSDIKFLNRISLNFLRHEMTEYEQILKKIKGKVGINEAYWKLKEKVNNAILEEYPFLKEALKDAVDD